MPPPAPGNLRLLSIAPNVVNMRWGIVVPTAGCSPAGFDILRAPGAGGGAFTPVGTSGGNSFTDTGLSPATTYRYQARTRDADGNLSALSNTVTVTTGPTAGRWPAERRRQQARAEQHHCREGKSGMELSKGPRDLAGTP
jgi:hypothetical protein